MVVTDYKMPKMDGVEFIARLRKLHPASAVILISGFTDTLGLYRGQHRRRRRHSEEQSRSDPPGSLGEPAPAQAATTRQEARGVARFSQRGEALR